ncbi:OmpA family protein [Rhodobacter capsulatus]|uniref:OmpA family protein n=1 Tax=Rhodobacter capsulatus TaxID=1061 RepID=UPI0003D2A0D5|nr:OmpA family protein [Rhodobacter capsulatus]ETD83392.1 flagellar motor protein MotB [Rhodobacter capsulatus B6]
MTRTVTLLFALALPGFAFGQSLEIVDVDGTHKLYLDPQDRLGVALEETSPTLAVPFVEDNTIAVPVTTADTVTAKGGADKIAVVFPTEPSPDPVGDTLLSGGTLQLFDILFDFDKRDVKPEARATLDPIGKTMRDHKDLKIRVIGHTDSLGGVEYNLKLSRERAEAVRQALVDWYGIDAQRIATEGRGLSEPIESNETEAGRARNRRVEVVRLD